MVKSVLVVSLLIVALFLGIGATLPDSWLVETSSVFAASPERILAEARDLESWEEWSTVRAAMGPNTEVSVQQPRSGAGAALVWRGPEGEATLTLLEASPEQGLRYRFSVTGTGVLGEGGLRFSPVDGGTDVTWYDEGQLDGLLPRWLWKLGVGLDEAIREHQETSLANLKLRIEGK